MKRRAWIFLVLTFVVAPILLMIFRQGMLKFFDCATCRNWIAFFAPPSDLNYPIGALRNSGTELILNPTYVGPYSVEYYGNDLFPKIDCNLPAEQITYLNSSEDPISIFSKYGQGKMLAVVRINPEMLNSTILCSVVPPLTVGQTIVVGRISEL